MRKITLLAVFAGLLPLLSVGMSYADEWESKKAQHFKPLTSEQQERIKNAVPDKAMNERQQSRRILVFYRCEGFIHDSIPWGNLALQEMAKQTGAFTVDLADTYDVFSSENLKQYDCIVLNNTTNMRFPKPSMQTAFMDFISGGKGLVGIHAASDNFGQHPECRDIVGGIFNGHPWNASGTWAFKLDDPEHVINQAFDQKGFWYQDEIYQYQPQSFAGPKVLRILVSLDMDQEAVSSQINDGPREVPVSWIRKYGDGRVFYTTFGHRQETFTKPMMLKHLLDGIQYAVGDLEADATPTAAATPKKAAMAPAL